MHVIARRCKSYQFFGLAPQRFKFRLLDADDTEFNHTIIVDIFFVDGHRPVLHIIDKATLFNAATFVED